MAIVFTKSGGVSVKDSKAFAKGQLAGKFGFAGGSSKGKGAAAAAAAAAAEKARQEELKKNQLSQDIEQEKSKLAQLASEINAARKKALDPLGLGVGRVSGMSSEQIAVGKFISGGSASIAQLEAELQRAREERARLEAERGKRTPTPLSVTPERKPSSFEVLTGFFKEPESRVNTIGSVREQVQEGGDKVKGLLDRFTPKFKTSGQKKAEGQISEDRKQLEKDIKNYEKNVANVNKATADYNKKVAEFDKKYGGKELSESDYQKYLRERAFLEDENKLLNRTIEKARSEGGDLKTKAEGFDNISLEKLKKAESKTFGSTALAVGGGIASGIAAIPSAFTGFVIHPVQSTKEVVEGVGEGQIQKQLSTPYGAGELIGNIAGPGIITKAVRKAGNVARATGKTPEISVSVSDITAVKVPGTQNVYRVSGTGKARIIDSATGKSLGEVTTKTEAVTVTAATKGEAVKAYSQGVAGTLSTSGDIKNFKVSSGVSKIRSKAAFQINEQGLAKGAGLNRIDEVLVGKGKFKKGKGSLKFKEAAPKSPTAAVLGVEERAAASMAGKRISVVESFGVQTGELGGALSPTGPVRPRYSVKKGIVSRDVVTILSGKEFSLEGKNIGAEPKRPSIQKKVTNQFTESMLGQKAAELAGVQTTKAVTEKVAKNTAQNIKTQNVVNEILGVSEKTAQETKQRVIPKNKASSIASAIAGTEGLSETKLLGKPKAKNLTATALAEAFGTGQTQGSKVKQASASANPGYAVPEAFGINPPKTTGGGIPLVFGFEGPKGSPGRKAGKEQKGKGRKKDLTASFAAVILGDKEVLTQEQFERRRKSAKFTGAEIRPIIEISGKKGKANNLNSLMNKLL